MKSYVYKLIHQIDVGDGAKSTSLIGFYSTRKKSKKVIGKYKKITGFKDFPNDFVIEKMEVDFDDFDFIEGV